MYTSKVTDRDDKIVNGDSNKEASDEEEGEIIEESNVAFYDKAKSFFDNISCDATERAKG